MGASQRRKGHAWEREVARRFRETFGLDEKAVKRGLSQPRGGTGEEPDVVLPPELGWWIECKVGARVNPIGALEQARAGIAEAKSSARPLAVCKPDRRTPVVTLDLDAFLALIGRLTILETALQTPAPKRPARVTVYASDEELP